MAIVAILDTDEDTVALLRTLLARQGIGAVTAYVHDIKAGEIDFVEFLHLHRPDAVIYDLAPPLEQNWRFMQLVRSATPLQNMPFVLTTTTSKAALEKILGPRDVYPLLSRPYDFNVVVQVVRSAIAQARRSDV